MNTPEPTDPATGSVSSDGGADTTAASAPDQGTVVTVRKRARRTPRRRATGRQDPSATTESRRGGRDALLPVAGILVVAGLIAAIVFAGIYGYRWYDDAENKQPVQTARDDALGGAEQAMLNILNIDLKDSDAYQKRLQSSVIGSARDQLLGSSGLGQLQKMAGDPSSAATLTAKLQRSAVVSLDDDRSTATTMVFLNVTSARPGQASSSQTMGFQVTVTKDAGVWKASTIQPLDSVAIDSTDAGAQPGAAPDSAAPAPDTAAPAPGGN
jgi:Mce-associated membrane protein